MYNRYHGGGEMRGGGGKWVDEESREGWSKKEMKQGKACG
jgi:hypothetical protein